MLVSLAMRFAVSRSWVVGRAPDRGVGGPARQLRRHPDPSGVGGHPLDAGEPGRGGEPQSHHLRRQRHHAIVRLRARGRLQRPEGAGDELEP